MKRILAALGGLGLGLILTWLCFYVLSHADLPQSSTGSACSDAEHCDGRWWIGAANLGVLLFPSIVCATAGYLAVARAWSLRKVALVMAGLVAGTALFAAAIFLA